LFDDGTARGTFDVLALHPRVFIHAFAGAEACFAESACDLNARITCDAAAAGKASFAAFRGLMIIFADD
jgi:hypothetical protein